MDEGFAAAVEAITARPLDPGAAVGLAEGFSRAGRADLAIALYRIWLRFNPEVAGRQVLEFNLSVLLDHSGRTDEAASLLTSALAAAPDFIEAYINLGGLRERSGDLKAAVEVWSSGATRLAGVSGARLRHKAVLLKQICRVLLSKQMYSAAEGLLKQCLELDPTQADAIGQLAAARLSLCKRPLWTSADPTDRSAFVRAVQPLSLAAYVDDPILQLAAAYDYANTAVPEPPDAAADRRFAATDVRGRRIRVGYVSSDLRDHAIGYLLAEVIERHDRSALETFAYACGPPSVSPLTQRLKQGFEHWRELDGLADGAAAAMIASDGIDILVDVNGLTKDARTGVFARRPAPIQVNWLGFPGSMGTPYHQYIIADPFVVPEGSELYFSERVVRVACYQANDRKRAVAEAPTRAAAGLPPDAFVYCCFNGSQKITRRALERWLEILKATPASVLWLLASTPETHAEIHAAAATDGVDPARIIFAPKLANAHHLARYPLADLFLDTFPYGAHTTASDALFMGVPVVTFAGKAFASRVCGSLVAAAGLEELITETPEAYVEEAVALARDPDRLAAMKARLRANRASCRLFDMDALASELRSLYEGLCRDHERGLTPTPDLRNLDLYHAIGVDLCDEGCEVLSDGELARLYRSRLAVRHRGRPVPEDARLWTSADRADAEAAIQEALRPAVDLAARPRRRA